MRKKQIKSQKSFGQANFGILNFFVIVIVSSRCNGAAFFHGLGLYPSPAANKELLLVTIETDDSFIFHLK